MQIASPSSKRYTTASAARLGLLYPLTYTRTRHLFYENQTGRVWNGNIVRLVRLACNRSKEQSSISAPTTCHLHNLSMLPSVLVKDFPTVFWWWCWSILTLHVTIVSVFVQRSMYYAVCLKCIEFPFRDFHHLRLRTGHVPWAGAAYQRKTSNLVRQRAAHPRHGRVASSFSIRTDTSNGEARILRDETL